MKRFIKSLLIAVLPLAVRKWLAIRINRCERLNALSRAYFATELLSDFARRDPNEYHRFLWANHLGYARTYEVEDRFGYSNFNESRRIFFAELDDRLKACGIESVDTVDSTLEVGCSLGYLLRYLETDVFVRATKFTGVDVDAHAIANGQQVLSDLESKVQLHCCDIQNLDSVISGQRFDFVLASGVLLYFDEDTATDIVRDLLMRTRGVLAITGLAHPAIDNAELESSVVRESDGTWVHNIDRMLQRAGARIAARRWGGGSNHRRKYNLLLVCNGG